MIDDAVLWLFVAKKGCKRLLEKVQIDNFHLQNRKHFDKDIHGFDLSITLMKKVMVKFLISNHFSIDLLAET